MKIIRYGERGEEHYGLIDRHDKIRSLAHYVQSSETICNETVASLRAMNIEGLPLVNGGVRLGAPLGNAGKVIGVGLNYTDHAIEAGLAVPPEPLIFLKPTSSICGPNDPVFLPRGSECLDWEVELAIAIGARAKNVEPMEARQCVLGYMVANDISERDWQFNHGQTWDKGKGYDNFCPLGPYLVTADEVPDPSQLALWLDVNGVRFQSGHTSKLVFGVDELISYISRILPLQVGDVILTGTPSGTGMGQKPPKYLKIGDIVTLGIEGLGEQRTFIEAE